MPLRHVRLEGANLETLRSEVVASLQRGELCVLPTETVYGLTALPSNPASKAKAAAWKGRDAQQPLTWHVGSVSDIVKLGGKLTLPAKRLITRYWPGPLTLILANNEGGTIGVRQPAHNFTQSVIEACGEPLWMTSVNAAGQPALIDPQEVAAACGDGVEIFADDGPSAIGVSSSIVRADRGELEVLREGILSTEEILSTAADLILFVCSGNTCRSPLAEEMAREVTAHAMGVNKERVLARGIKFASAGTATDSGMMASEGSQAAASEVGLDLSSHISQPIDPLLWQRAMKIYCLGESHRSSLLEVAPDIGDKVELLRPDGQDIADPYGGDLHAYQHTRDEIRAAIMTRMADWWP